MTLRETMARHALILTRLDHFGEELVYAFKAGGTRTVRAVVDRLDIEPAMPGQPQIKVRRAHVCIPRDATLGITAVVNGDKVTMAMRVGEAPEVARVRRIVTQDEGFFLVEVES